MNSQLKQRVQDRAQNRCEYCQIPQSAHPQRFPLDHFIPRKHGGIDDESNLALCCPMCNLHKGSNLSGIDPTSGQIHPLFNPRRDKWTEHFTWRGATLTGNTPTGRVTIAVMNINDAQRIELRQLTMGL
jgi:HNH endonuclease